MLIENNEAETQEAQVQGQGEASEPGSPPAGEKTDVPKSPLEAVREALAETSQQPDDSKKQAPDAKAADSPPEQEKDGKDAVPKGEGEDADKDLPFNQHPRFRQLVKERKEALQQVEQFSDKAGRLDELVDQVVKLDLVPQEYDTALNLASMAKRAAATNDANSAKQLIPHFRGIVQQLSQIAGEALPSDLQDLVDSADMSTEQAMEVSRLRRENEALQRNVRGADAFRQREAQDRAHAEREHVVTSVKTTLDSWESQWAGSDPDFETLRPYVRDRIVAVIGLKGPPKNADEALKIANDAKIAVVSELKGIKGAGRTSIRGPSGGTPNGSSRPVPKSSLDVVRLALSGGG